MQKQINKLIAGEIDEKGELETALFCTCPICFKKCKVDLNLKLVGVKQTMLFKSKVVKRYKFMWKVAEMIKFGDLKENFAATINALNSLKGVSVGARMLAIAVF